MLRYNRNRKKTTTKGKHSDPTKTMDKVPSKQYEESYNEVILNDLVPEEKRSEFGLESDTPKMNNKKSGGLKLNFGLNGKKNKNSKGTNKENTSSKTENKDQNHKKETQDKNSHSESTGKKSKAKPDQNQSKNKSNKNKSSKNQKPTDESTNKGKGSKSSSKTTKQPKNSKAKKSSIEEISEEQDINTNINTNTNASEHETKKHSRPVVNPKRRRRPEVESNEPIRGNSENIQKEVNLVEEESEEATDSLGFRTVEEEEIEVEDVKSKFEDLVWSEDKFPKK